MYFSYKRILSYNALLNMIIAERGVGKTYGATKLVINDFLKKGNEFVYIRRYKTDLQKGCKKFFEAVIQNEEFPEHSLVSKGREFYINDTLDWFCEHYGVEKEYVVELLKSYLRNKRKTTMFKYSKLSGSKLNKIVGTEPDPDYRKYDAIRKNVQYEENDRDDEVK